MFARQSDLTTTAMACASSTRTVSRTTVARVDRKLRAVLSLGALLAIGATVACQRSEPSTSPPNHAQPPSPASSQVETAGAEGREGQPVTRSSEGAQPATEPSGLDAAPKGQGEPENHVSNNSVSKASAPTPKRKKGFPFTLAVPGAVRSIAFGKAPRMAVLAAEPHIFDGESWDVHSLPPSLRLGSSSRESVEIFFGRDNQPRLMGTRFERDSTSAVYFRHLRSGWRKEPAELGPLAKSKSLYGILGYADPEVVCEPGAFCLVKRNSGWGRTEADAEPRRLFLTEAGVYKQLAGRLWLLNGNEWADVAPLAFEPRDLCRDTAGTLWLVGGTPAKPFALGSESGAQPTVVEVPVKGARRVYCSSDGAVWLAGDDGLLLKDAAGWWSVDVPPGKISVLAGRVPGELWVGTSEGLFVGSAAE